MSKKRVITALSSLGLSRLEAEIYIHLSREGPQELGEIANSIRLNDPSLFVALKNLREMGIIKVESDSESQIRFFAYPIVEVLDSLVENNLEEAARVEQNKQELLSLWNLTVKKCE